MNLRDLQYLIAVADTLHFAKAAELCHVSQPTLSMQLKKLEDELQIQFFERNHKKILLTETGRVLVDQARHVVKEAQHLKEMARFAADPLAGSLRLGCIPTLAPYLLPRVLSTIKKELPRLELFLIEEQTHILLNQLKSGKIDAAILALPVANDEFEVCELFDEKFWVAMPLEHPLSQKKKVHVSDLKNQNLLLLTEGHCLREQALAVCEMEQQQILPSFSATSLETLRQMVALGNGVTLLPELCINDNPMITLRPFADPAPFRR
ncbi:MAG TPA: LysR substrate-binding domain-containing protein, partial [Coxiellaceae bacterium]|nr:LysR substrate-binding domain-containing protein [Coxiellaceae bacterium]